MAMTFGAHALLLVAAFGCGKVEDGDGGGGDGDGSGDHRDGGGGDGETDGGIGPVDDCEPGEAIACDGVELRVCNDAGDGEERVTCGLRCNPEGPACEQIIDPSNGLAAALDLAESAPALLIDGGGTVFFDTVEEVSGTTATIAGQAFETTIVPGAGTNPDILVVPVASLRVVAGTTFSVQGTRAIAFASWGDVRIQGTLRVVAGRSEEVEEDCWGRSSDPVGNDDDIPGPGGGSFASFGGNGGSITGVAGGAGHAGGDLVGGETLVPLRGGCPGGSDGIGGQGIGGGALQIASRTLVTVPGAIGANGGGGCVSSGGGSGGAILLEAPLVTVAGGLFANGGGGGCGGFDCGESGTNSTTPAPGNDICAEAVGGNGAAGDSEATDGTSDTNTAGQVDRAGGGGGGFGRIRINTLDGTVTGASTFSPQPSLATVAGR
ncbi:MAG TPA: hypothetical protein VFU21_23190 [Kofleriaceae bacterium]|nr:hypothetical protein [Kofleriaceae bacterium]